MVLISKIINSYTFFLKLMCDYSSKIEYDQMAKMMGNYNIICAKIILVMCEHDINIFMLKDLKIELLHVLFFKKKEIR